MGVLKLSFLSAVVYRRSNGAVACKLGLNCIEMGIDIGLFKK